MYGYFMFENVNFEKVVVAVSFILSHLSWIAVYAVILLLILVLPKYIISAARSILFHLFFYIITPAFCFIYGFKLSIKRFPFASFFGLSRKCDICITDRERVYRIHILSLINPFRTAVTISPDGLCLTYVSSASLRKRVSEEGSFLLSSGELLGYSRDKRVKLPLLEKENNSDIKEVILVCPKPLLIGSTGSYGELYGIEEINGVLWGCYRDFFKYLRRTAK